MPVNFQQIQQKVKQIGQLAPGEHKKLLERREKARILLHQHAFELEKLSALFQRALALNSAFALCHPHIRSTHLPRPDPRPRYPDRIAGSRRFANQP